MSPKCWLRAGLLIGAAALIGPTSPAGAGITKGTCNGSGTFLTGTEADGTFTIVAATAGDTVYVVPRSDTVSWEGSVPGPPGEYSGSISVKLPPPFGEWEIDSWSGDSQTTSNKGTEEYDLPGLAPSGVTFQVYGQHADANGVCTGFVNLEIEGGPFESPLTYISLALTAGTLAAFLGLIRPVFRRVA